MKTLLMMSASTSPHSPNEPKTEMMSILGKQAAAMKALADFVAKVRNDDVDHHNEHTTAIEQLSQGQMKIAQFTDGLATQYGQLFKALSNRLDAVEKEAFGPNYDHQTSTPPLNSRRELQFITRTVQGPGIRCSLRVGRRILR
jgi:hypothetical protein